MLSRKTPMKRTGFAPKAGAGLKRTAFKVKVVDGPKSSTFKATAKKPMKSSKPSSTAAEKRHLGSVALLGCIVCDHCLGLSGTPAQVHHIRSGQGKMRAGHFLTIPLCPTHHQGSGLGVHDMGREEFARMYGIGELGLLEITYSRLGIPMPDDALALVGKYN